MHAKLIQLAFTDSRNIHEPIQGVCADSRNICEAHLGDFHGFAQCAREPKRRVGHLAPSVHDPMQELLEDLAIGHG